MHLLGLVMVINCRVRQKHGVLEVYLPCEEMKEYLIPGDFFTVVNFLDNIVHG